MQGMIAAVRDIEARLNKIRPRGKINSHPVGELSVKFNNTTLGATVTFTMRDKSNMQAVTLKRNLSLDFGSAKILQTWDVKAISVGDALAFDDNDPTLRNQTNAYYWVECVSYYADEDITQNVIVGPQTLVVNGDVLVPEICSDFDASHAAVSGGTVVVSVSFVPPSKRFGSVKIYASGYQGVVGNVAVAQTATSPYSFKMQQTGETVTLTCVAVSFTGIESTGANPTKSLTLGSAATVPAKVMGVTAAGLTTGVQLSFIASAETNITSYAIYRALLSAGFGSASNIGSVAPTGATSYTYLDTGGTAAEYEYYVIAVNVIGNSAASAAATNVIGSQNLPPNVPVNTTNTATVDSIDNGTNATIRVYGGGGVGSTWTRPTGSGTMTYPAGTIVGVAYSTKYYVMYDGANYSTFTTIPSTVPDKYIYAGTTTTCAAGGGGGTSGGGGGTGGGGGRTGNLS